MEFLQPDLGFQLVGSPGLDPSGLLETNQAQPPLLHRVTQLIHVVRYHPHDVRAANAYGLHTIGDIRSVNECLLEPFCRHFA